MSFKVLVTGGRGYADHNAVFRALDKLHEAHPDLYVIEGGAQGADRHARLWRTNHRRPGKTCPADWAQHGRAAGVIRNQQMLTEEKPDLVLAFPGGIGTRDMITRAKKAGVPVQIEKESP